MTYPTTSQYTKVSSADALWALILRQPKSTRRTLAERLLKDDLKMAEELVLKVSIEKGWQQVKAMQEKGTATNSLQDLIDELRAS